MNDPNEFNQKSIKPRNSNQIANPVNSDVQAYQQPPTHSQPPQNYIPPQINVNVSNVNSANAYAGTIVSRKSRIIALLLCIFLVFFGIHRFYLGKTVTGIIFFFTCGLFFIGYIWDLVMLVMNNAKDGDGYPLT